MALNREEKIGLWVTLAIMVVVIVWLLFRRTAASSDTGLSAPTFTPSYLTYNYPNYSNGPWQGTATGLPAIPAANPASGCGCTGGTNGFYTSLQQMLNSFQTGAGAAFQKYENAVFNSFPSSVSQYFNNPAGAAASATSQGVLGS